MAADRRKDQKQQRLRQEGTLNPRPNTVTHELFHSGEFFDATDLLQVKYEMLRLTQVEKRSVSEAAKACGFSRPTFYQAQSAFEQNGLAGLIAKKSGPRSGHKLTPAVMELLTQTRVTDPSVRPQQLALLAKKKFGVNVHPRSIERQFRRQKKLQ